MAKYGVTLVLAAGVLVGCGGTDVHNERAPGVAGASGATMQSSTGGGNGGQAGSAVSLGGGGVGPSVAGAAGQGGGGGVAGGGAAGAGAAGQAGAGAAGQAGAGGAVSTPEMLVPTVMAFCAAARTCCAQQSDPVMLDDCESGFGAKDQTSQSLARGTVAIDPADLAKCLAAYQAAATSCEENPVLEACAGIVQGKVAAGGACTLGVECAGSGPKACLVTGGQDSLGVCKATPGGKAGDACSLTCRPNELCTFTVYGASDSPLTPCLESDGLFCNYDMVPAKCQPLHAVGAQCQQDDECGFLAYCDSSGSSTCKKRSQLNETCGTCISSLTCKDGKCQSPPLSVGSTCDGYSLGPY